MANSLSSLNPAFWAREAQRSLFVENKAMAIANTTLRNLVAGEGDTVHRTILSYPASTTYVPGTDITSVAMTGSKESLTIGTWFASLVTIDDTEKKQNILEVGRLASDRMMKDHNNRIEQAVLDEITNAKFSIDDGNVGGTNGNSIVVNTATVTQIFIAADTKLDAIDAPKAGRTAVIGGHFLGMVKLQQAGRNTIFADGINQRGIVTNLFGWDLLYSNNLPYSATIGLATQPTDGDVIIAAGVTFTFKTALTPAAGEVLIGGSAANANTNLAKAINDSGTVNTHYGQLSAEDRFLISYKRRITATAGATSTALAGYGDIVISETLTAATDKITNQKQKALFCVRGCIDIIVQIPPHVESQRAPLQFADIVKSLLGFGKKTYGDGAREMVYAPIDASTSDWR